MSLLLHISYSININTAGLEDVSRRTGRQARLAATPPPAGRRDQDEEEGGREGGPRRCRAHQTPRRRHPRHLQPHRVQLVVTRPRTCWWVCCTSLSGLSGLVTRADRPELHRRSISSRGPYRCGRNTCSYSFGLTGVKVWAEHLQLHRCTGVQV